MRDNNRLLLEAAAFCTVYYAAHRKVKHTLLKIINRHCEYINVARSFPIFSVNPQIDGKYRLSHRREDM